MSLVPSPSPGRRVRVVLSTTALLSFISVWKAAAFALAELGAGVFFVMGPARAVSGDAAVWFVLAMACLAAFVRAVDIESWALFMPGGLVGRVDQAFGPRARRATAAAVLAERVLLGSVACVVVGHYVASVTVTALAGWRLSGHVTTESIAALVAVSVVGLLWIRARLGFDLPPRAIARSVWIGVALLALVTVWGVVTAIIHRDASWNVLAAAHLRMRRDTWWALDAVLPAFFGLALALPTVGGGEALARMAHEFEPPRVLALRRTGRLVVLFAFAGTALLTCLFVVLVPPLELPLWFDAPLAGLVQHFSGPAWLRGLVTAGVAVSAVLLLVPAAHAALSDGEQTLRRLSAERVLPEGLAFPHPRFGTLARAIDVTAAATVLIIITSGGRVTWLARAYAIALTFTLLLKIAALIRLRRLRPAARPFRAPFNVPWRGRDWPVGLAAAWLLLALVALAVLGAGDIPSISTTSLLVGLIVVLLAPRARAEGPPGGAELDAFELLPATDLPLGQVEARPGNVLVPVRRPQSLAHLAVALQTPGDRDIVVMTARLLGIDVDDDAFAETTPTPAEQRLFSQVVAVAERYRRPVRLLIVPTRDVFEAVAQTIVRLRSVEVHVGESSSLPANEQARLLGEVWEDTPKPEALQVRLVVHHHSGRADAYHLGAHPPSLTPADLDLIHRVWLDAVKAVGPHVHHHDVVRAALTQMQQQLDGPNRDQSLGLIRQVARPAEELAAVVRDRDFSRLRDMVRNRPPSEVAAVLTDLSQEDQVVVFRVLPRKDAAAVFEYLSLEAQEALLKTMAQEDVAALLNNMAPDDRTMFLEELPAAATRQLLTLLTPVERSVALTLLGYPEGSIGRLMTPHYVAVRAHWTVREVLDYVRTHGQDSETLNVIYVVDEQGLLIDDIRIREILLVSPDQRVDELMDRRFLALKATDDQETAVASFRAHDRTALPVTDSVGMLIGIVTIDDVLDVAEETATREIQRIGGSEALDEPYMRIAFGRMIQKRAGWLTALFLGEMLTATAMGVFEKEISKAVVLALFVPLIISSGGNSGSQASTLVIRALALGEVGLADWWRVMRREVWAGLSLGGILGAIGFLRITLWAQFSNIYTEHYLLVAFTVAFALVGIVLWGTLIGSLLPFLLRRLGFDPATSSAPFVATLVDVTGLVIYFSVAMVILRGTLL
jgi:magnesium transporter